MSFIHQIPTESYKATRQHFCTSFIRKCEQISDIDKELRYSDKTHFHVDGKIDRKNRIWSHGKTDMVAKAPLHSVKFTYAMITEQQGRHRALLLRDVSGDTQTVNAQRYRTVLSKFGRALKTKQKNDTEALQCSWFQQDVAQPTPPKKPRIGYRSAWESVSCQCLRSVPDHPAPRT